MILDYKVYPYEKYITETKTVVKENEKYEVMKKQKFYFIELPKYRKQRYNKNDKVSQWLAFIDGEDKERMKEAMIKNKEIKKAKEEYEYLTGDEELQRIAELKQKWQLDYNSLMHDSYEDGLEDGISKGKKENKIQIAKEMVKNNFETKVISKIIKLSIKEIEKIKKL